jgi:hypothetical protein
MKVRFPPTKRVVVVVLVLFVVIVYCNTYLNHYHKVAQQLEYDDHKCDYCAFDCSFHVLCVFTSSL